MNPSATNQSCSDTMDSVLLALKNRQASASDLAQKLSVDTVVSVTAQTVQRTLHNIINL